MSLPRLATCGGSLGGEEPDRHEGERDLDHGEQGQCSTEADVEHFTEHEAAEPKAQEQREHVEPHRLPWAGTTERRDDACEQRLRCIVAQREHRHGHDRDEERHVEDQGGSPDGTKGEPDRQEPSAPITVGDPPNCGAEQEAWNAVADEGQSNADWSKAVALLEVEPEPRELGLPRFCGRLWGLADQGPGCGFWGMLLFVDEG